MRRRLPLVAVAVVIAAAMSGCVTMPDSGPVVQTGSQGAVTSDRGFSYDPRPPKPGASQPEVVRGFLDAMRAAPIQTRTAKEFLTTDAAAAWTPHHQTVTYASPPTPRETDEGIAVRLDDPNRLDSRGAWRGSLPRGQRTITFPMTLEDGEWRIDAAPNALIVPEDWFQLYYRQVSVYYFDPTASILEPEPVFVPRGEQLATALTQALLPGPGPGLANVAQSFVPPGLDVAVGVSVSADGVADLLLTGDAGPLTPKTTELMMAQLAWTLRQEPDIKSVRVSIGDQPVPLPGGVSSYRVDGGAEYDPAGFQASPLLYGVRRSRLVSGTATGMVPVDGPFGTPVPGLDAVSVSVDGGSVAGVTGGGTSVRVGPLAARDRGQVRPVLAGTRLLRPTWDFAGRLWLVDRAAGRARVSYVARGAATPVTVPGVTGEDVRMFLVSRDGTRLVAVVHRPAGDVLVISRIQHNGAGRVLGATRAEQIDPAGDADVPIRGITWRTSASIAVLRPLTPSLSGVGVASVDGSPPSPETPSIAVDGRVRSLAGSPVPSESVYGVRRRALVDISSSERRVTPLERGTTSVVYAG
jgi:hypothetical protein